MAVEMDRSGRIAVVLFYSVYDCTEVVGSGSTKLWHQLLTMM